MNMFVILSVAKDLWGNTRWTIHRRVGIGIVSFGVFAILTSYLIVQSAARFIVPIDQIEPAPVAIVLGAKVKANGEPSDILADRLLTAVDAYDRGLVETLILSGDNGTVVYDEVNAMRAFVLKRGVEPVDVFLDHAGFDTYDSMVRANEVFGVTSAIIVTQDFHLPRALFLARSQGIVAQGLSADRQPYLGAISSRIREIPASVKAALNVLLNTQPTYLGPPIDITGDGQVTWDEKE